MRDLDPTHVEAVARDQLIESGRLLGDEQCCPDACDGGACESCSGCYAGWCVNGHDFLDGEWERMSDEDRKVWWSVAREHNAGIDAALRRAESAEARIEAVRALHRSREHIFRDGIRRDICDECTDGEIPVPHPCPTIEALDGEGADR